MAEVQITSQDLNISGKVVKVVHFNGQLDETNVDNEAQKIYQLIDSMAEPHLILNFAQLSYMNSKSIGYVTDWYSRVAGKNGTVSIAQPQPNILDILKVVGLTQIVKIYNTLEEAQKELGATPTAAPTIPTQPATETPMAPNTPAAPAPAPTQTTTETPAAINVTPGSTDPNSPAQ